MEELINAYKMLSIEDKKAELAEEFTSLLGVIQKLRNDVEIKTPVNSSIVTKLYSKTSSEEEYLTNIYENMLSIKEELAIYLDKIADILYEE